MADINGLYLLKRFFYDRTNGSTNWRVYEYRYPPWFIGPHDFLCYGCDQGRNGYVINVKRKLGDIEVQEEACSGCMAFLDSIRLFSIPFAQLDSHEGCIRWAIASSDYYEHRQLFTFAPFIDTYHKDGYVEFQFSDRGYEDVQLIGALLKAGLSELDHYDLTSKEAKTSLDELFSKQRNCAMRWM